MNVKSLLREQNASMTKVAKYGLKELAVLIVTLTYR